MFKKCDYYLAIEKGQKSRHVIVMRRIRIRRSHEVDSTQAEQSEKLGQNAPGHTVYANFQKLR